MPSWAQLEFYVDFVQNMYRSINFSFLPYKSGEVFTQYHLENKIS